MKKPLTLNKALAEIAKDRNVFIECASCEGSFRLKDAEIFYGDDLTPSAKEYLDQRKEKIAELKSQYLRRKKTLEDTPKKTVSVNIGKTVEKVVPVLPGFPFHPHDCRTLFDPIDYIVFKGLSENDGVVEQINFVDVKTGNARLNQHQQEIRQTIKRGRVKFKYFS